MTRLEFRIQIFVGFTAEIKLPKGSKSQKKLILEISCLLVIIFPIYMLKSLSPGLVSCTSYFLLVATNFVYQRCD